MFLDPWATKIYSLRVLIYLQESKSPKNIVISFAYTSQGKGEIRKPSL